MTLFRDILKGILPRIFLKRAFLKFNTLKTKTWDRIFFSEEQIPLNLFVLHEKRNPFLFHSIDTSKFDVAVREKMAIWEDSEWTQDQYLLHYTREGFIEPRVGWGVSLSRRLIYPSLGFSFAPHVHKPDFWEFYFTRRIINLNRVISLRDTGEENYFHFFNDVLAKLFFLIEKGILIENYTIVIGQKLYVKDYFRYVLSNSFLGKLKWHVQREHEWVRFTEGIFCKPYTHTKKYFDKVIQLTMKEPKGNSERRLFINRPVSSFRYIENFSEIERLLKQHSFEVVDTSQLSFSSQIELFSQCRHLVAIHGAGITNMIFRNNKPLSLLEIVQPSPYIPFHYILMAKLFNYDYDVLCGKKGKESGRGGFVVDANDFESKLYQVLNTRR